MHQGNPPQPPNSGEEEAEPSLYHISLRGNYCNEWKQWLTADQQASIFNAILKDPELGEASESVPGLFALTPDCAKDVRISYIVDGIEIAIFHIGPSNITYQATTDQMARVKILSHRLLKGIGPFAYEVAAHGAAYGVFKVIEHAIK